MGKKEIESWKDCRDFRTVETFADRKGCKRRAGKGDHEVIEAPSGDSFAIYCREMSTGVACALFRWFKEQGLITKCIVLLVLGAGTLSIASIIL
jgi:hypothetical protein